jgi:hypothetical protein
VGQVPLVGLYKHDDDISGSIKEDIFDQLSNCQLLMKYAVPWS